MIRVQDLFKMSEEDIKKFLLGKKVKHKNGFHGLLAELGIQGKILNVSKYVDNLVMKKPWCWGYETLASPGILDGFSISNDKIVIDLDIEPCKERIGRLISWLVEVIPKRPPRFFKVVKVDVRSCAMPTINLDYKP